MKKEPIVRGADYVRKLDGLGKSTFKLRLCTWIEGYTYGHDYPVIFESNSAKEVADFIEANYPYARKQELMTEHTRQSVVNRRPYLHLLHSPDRGHSYIYGFTITEQDYQTGA
jgi:hypothetical protein